MSYVYVILNTRNGKVYVGWTNNPRERWRKHRKNASLGMQYFLYRALAKELDVFEFTVIATHHSEQEAMQAEKYWIRFYQSTDDRLGYNMTEGGEGCVLRGSKNPMFGKHGPRLGIQHTEDTKRKMRESQSSLHKELVEQRKCELSVLGPLLTERGIITALALDWKVSHTQVRRFIKKHIPS